MNPPTQRRSRRELRQLGLSDRQAQILDALAGSVKSGRASAFDLAGITNTNDGVVLRLLRGLAVKGWVKQTQPGIHGEWQLVKHPHP